jgi:hypothetical protein
LSNAVIAHLAPQRDEPILIGDGQPPKQQRRRDREYRDRETQAKRQDESDRERK